MPYWERLWKIFRDWVKSQRIFLISWDKSVIKFGRRVIYLWFTISGPPRVLLPCSICSRTFRPEVLERHTKVCEKSATKKRKVFDSFKNRVHGTELEEFLGPAPLPNQPVKKPERSPPKKHSDVNKPKWKETHEKLIAVLRTARGAEEENLPVPVNKHAGSCDQKDCNIIQRVLYG